jgi:hypothetical protein
MADLNPYYFIIASLSLGDKLTYILTSLSELRPVAPPDGD